MSEDILGWRYDGAYHCTACAQKRFGAVSDPELVPYDAVDSTGKLVEAIFFETEWFDPTSVEKQILKCSTCDAKIHELAAPPTGEGEDLAGS